MFYHVIGGFIIPWILGIYLYKKQAKLVTLFVPVGSAIAFLINEWGVNFFWQVKPSFLNLSLSSMPYNLGSYPVWASLFVIVIHHRKLNVKTAFLIFVTVTTLIELISVLQDKIIYRNGWNIFWTACSYLISYLLIFLYYQLLKKHKIL